MRDLSRPWLAVAALVLSLTLQLSDGFYHEPALPWLGLALVAAICGLTGVSWPWGATSDRHAQMTRGLLTAGVLVSALALVTRPLARYMPDPRPWAHPDLLVAVAAAAGIALSVHAAHGRAAMTRACIALVAIGLWLGAWTVRESPEPHIDVIPVHQDAFAAVARGQSPYGITFADMYGAHEPFYAAEMRDGQRVLFGFPYPPLSLLLAWPGHALLGDLRYSEVLALVLAVALIATTGTHVWGRATASGPAGVVPTGASVGLLCGAALLLSPRVVFHLEQGWTEPFPILLLALTVAVAVRRPSVAWLPLGLLVASKQHMLVALAFVPLLVSRTSAVVQEDGIGRARRMWPMLWFGGKAVAVAAVVTLPLALLDVDAFVRSAVMLQVREPFRLDSLSFTRLFVALGWALDKHGALAVSMAAGLLGVGLAWWRAPRTPAGFAAALGVTCFLLAAFGKKAFLNYYYLVVACLLVSVAAAGRVTEPWQAPATRMPRD
jgi:hypothetical protein